MSNRQPVQAQPRTGLGEVDLKYVAGVIEIYKMHPDGVVPSKQNPSDVGHDIVLIGRKDGRVDDRMGDVNLFNTGIAIIPPRGYHIEIIARSSLQNDGYMLANNVGVIDPNYRGEIIVALYKFRDGPDLELPSRSVQMVLRKTEYGRIKNCSPGAFEAQTDRGAGGFGSTGRGAFGASASTGSNLF